MEMIESSFPFMARDRDISATPQPGISSIMPWLQNNNEIPHSNFFRRLGSIQVRSISPYPSSLEVENQAQDSIPKIMSRYQGG